MHIATLLLAMTVMVVAQTASAQPQHSIYIEPMEDTDFDVFIAAALSKKGVPIAVTVAPEAADFVMRASAIEVEKQSTGSKWARCLFAYCAGIEDRSNVSVQVLDRDGMVRWSYAVNKGRGQKNKQSMAEAIAKHFKTGYVKIQREGRIARALPVTSSPGRVPRPLGHGTPSAQAVSTTPVKPSVTSAPAVENACDLAMLPGQLAIVGQTGADIFVNPTVTRTPFARLEPGVAVKVRDVEAGDWVLVTFTDAQSRERYGRVICTAVAPL